MILLCLLISLFVAASVYLVFFFFYCYGAHRDLHSFPTRRSSDPGLQALDEGAARGPVVAPDGDARRPLQPFPSERRDPLPDRLRPLGRELVAHDAPDVVLAENGGGELHGTRLPQRPVGSRREAGGASDEAAGATRTEAPLTRAMSSSRFGRTPKKSSPATAAATTALPSRPSRMPACASAEGSGCMYIAMITGR